MGNTKKMITSSDNRVSDHTTGHKVNRKLHKYLPLYIMFIPVVIYYILFCYLPMGGAVIAFKDYNLSLGILGSPFVGLKHFVKFLSNNEFWRILLNTFRLAFIRIIIGFPLPILIAVLLNELKNIHYKKAVQTIIYLPHFLSWVIIYGFVFIFFSSDGIINQLVKTLGGSSISFMSSKKAYAPIFIGSALWKEVGWNTIIFLAALSGIDQEQIEAAKIDGAGRFQRIWHIILPSIRNVICIQLTLTLGGILSVSFEQTMIMINDSVRPVAEVIDYYIYRMGLLTANNYSFSAAVGLFRNIISLFLVLLTNKIIHKIDEGGALW